MTYGRGGCGPRSRARRRCRLPIPTTFSGRQRVPRPFGDLAFGYEPPTARPARRKSRKGEILGHIISEELGLPGDLLAIDGVQLEELDYVDIGEVIEPAGVVPLVIKSLVFS